MKFGQRGSPGPQRAESLIGPLYLQTESMAVENGNASRLAAGDRSGQTHFGVVDGPTTFKTPSGTVSCKTPSDGASASQISWADGHVSVNPFEVGLESLHLPTCSPSVFLTKSSNCREESKFEWSIDEIANLKPASIDETSHRDNHQQANLEVEEKAQRAIEAYFSQNSVVPSPWGMSDEPFVPHTGHTYDSARADVDDCCGSAYASAKPAIHGREVWTQTELALPPHVDLEKILGCFFTFYENQYLQYEPTWSEESAIDIKEVLSSSSLRRKLFFTAHDNFTACDLEEDNSCRFTSSPASRRLAKLNKMVSSYVRCSPSGRKNGAAATSPVDGVVLATPDVSPIYALSSPAIKDSLGCSARLDEPPPPAHPVPNALGRSDVSMRNVEMSSFYMSFSEQNETSSCRKSMDFSPCQGIGNKATETGRHVPGRLCSPDGCAWTGSSGPSVEVCAADPGTVPRTDRANGPEGLARPVGKVVRPEDVLVAGAAVFPPRGFAAACQNGTMLSCDSAYFGGTSDETGDVGSCAASARSGPLPVEADMSLGGRFHESSSPWVPAACSTPAMH